MRYNCIILGISCILLNFKFLCSVTLIVTASLVLTNYSKISQTLNETQLWCFRAQLRFSELHVFVLTHITYYSQSCSMNCSKIQLTPNEIELQYFRDQLHFILNFMFLCSLTLNITTSLVLTNCFKISLILNEIGCSILEISCIVVQL